MKEKFKTEEKILSFFVILMGASFLLTVFLVAPSWEDIFKGLTPQIPDEENAVLIVAGIAGTGIALNAIA